MRRRLRRVVLLMAHPGNEVCEALAAALSEVSRRNERTKFVRVVASEAVPGYPRRLCPTLIVYWKGDVVKRYVCRRPFACALHVATSRQQPADVLPPLLFPSASLALNPLVGRRG